MDQTAPVGKACLDQRPPKSAAKKSCREGPSRRPPTRPPLTFTDGASVSVRDGGITALARANIGNLGEWQWSSAQEFLACADTKMRHLAISDGSDFQSLLTRKHAELKVTVIGDPQAGLSPEELVETRRVNAALSLRTLVPDSRGVAVPPMFVHQR